MDMIRHDAIRVEFILAAGFLVDFIRHNLRDSVLPEPVVSMLATVKPLIVMSEIFFLNFVAFFGAFGGLQFFFALGLQFRDYRGWKRIHDVEGDEERVVLRVDMRQFAAVMDGFGYGRFGGTTNFSLSFAIRKLKLQYNKL